MDKNNLIDFNNDKSYKVSSPLIPAPKSTALRLSDVENNPFDKCLRKISDKDDPFECNLDTSYHKNIIEENKENVGHLISPVETPVKSKKYKKISSSPLYITNNLNDVKKDLSPGQLPILSDIQNLSSDCNVTDTSLQILSDSILDNDDSFNFACNIPLPNSPEENKNIIDHKSTEQIGKKLSVMSSITSKDSLNPNSLHLESLGISDISHVFSSVTSSDYDNDNQLNKAFLNENSNIRIEQRRCLSVRKPSNNIIHIAKTTKPTNLNNSFAGFNYNSRNIKYETFKNCDNYNDDSVFLEATQLAEVFRTSAALADLNDEDISQCTPPWLEENILFLDEDQADDQPKNECDDNGLVININNIPIIQVESPHVLEERKENEIEKSKEIIEQKNDEVENKSSQVNSTADYNESDVETKNELKNAKDLLHNLSEILSNNGTVVDKRKLGESLLNSLALALNIETPNTNKVTGTSKSINKLQKSKSDSKIGEIKRTSLEKKEFKVSVPKIKTQTAAPVKLDKNLKLRNEKEKVTSAKGPLKALLPVTNMAKNKKSIASKVSLHHATPPKQSLHSLYQIKKISTPNEPKLKPPIAQSTPEITKLQGTDHGTPLSKRHFGLAVSPLTKPKSTNDLSNVSLNNSVSPKSISGSVPNLNKSGISSLKQSTNSSIPTVKSKLNRRNSASDMATSSSSSLNRSYDNSEPIRPPVQLKRSSSFQNKSSIQKPNNIDNNNTVKKYGMPGPLKSLRLVKK